MTSFTNTLSGLSVKQGRLDFQGGRERGLEREMKEGGDGGGKRLDREWGEERVKVRLESACKE